MPRILGLRSRFNCTCKIHRYMMNAKVGDTLENQQVPNFGLSVYQVNAHQVVTRSDPLANDLRTRLVNFFGNKIRIVKISIEVANVELELQEMEITEHNDNLDHFVSMTPSGETKLTHYQAVHEMSDGSYSKTQIQNSSTNS